MRRRASVEHALDDGASILQRAELLPGRWYLVTLTPLSRVVDLDGLRAQRAAYHAAAERLTSAVGGRAVLVHEATVKWEEPTALENPWLGAEGAHRAGTVGLLPAMHWHAHILVRAPYLCVSVEASAMPGHKARTAGLPATWWDYTPELLLQGDGVGVDVQVLNDASAAASYVAKAYVSKVGAVKHRDGSWSTEQELLADSLIMHAWRAALGRPRMVVSYGERPSWWRHRASAPLTPVPAPLGVEPRVVLGAVDDPVVHVREGRQVRPAVVRRAAYGRIGDRPARRRSDVPSRLRRERLIDFVELATRTAACSTLALPKVRLGLWLPLGLSSIRMSQRRWVARVRGGLAALLAREGGPDVGPHIGGSVRYVTLGGGGRVGVWAGAVVWRDGHVVQREIERLALRCLQAGWYTAAKHLLWSSRDGWESTV